MTWIGIATRVASAVRKHTNANDLRLKRREKSLKPGLIRPCKHSTISPTGQSCRLWSLGTWYHRAHKRDYLIRSESKTSDTHLQCLFPFSVSEMRSCWGQAWTHRSHVQHYLDPTTWTWPSVWMASGELHHTDRAWQQRTQRCVFLVPCHLRLNKCGHTSCIHSDWCRSKGCRKRLAARWLLRFFYVQIQLFSTATGHRSLKTPVAWCILPNQPRWRF